MLTQHNKVKGKSTEKGKPQTVLPQIHVSRPVLQELKAAFPDCTRENIYLALRFHRNSELAQEIRATAIEFKEMELKRDKSYEH